jgi:hypothetical protein
MSEKHWSFRDGGKLHQGNAELREQADFTEEKVVAGAGFEPATFGL